jgi:hypothetical protein
MHTTLIVSLIALSLVASNQRRSQCLPEGIKPTEIVAIEPVKSTNGSEVTTRKVTAEEKLDLLKAQCKKGKLVDSRGREIRFYRLIGCWGNPPADYLEILERQQQEIADLKKRFMVVEIPCSLSIDPAVVH